MANMQAIPSMRAKALVVVATRAQDQDLVAHAADRMGVTEDDFRADFTASGAEHKLVPAFGWHPWFSHQMYDEIHYRHAPKLSKDQKRAHYQSVLAPRSDDAAFLDALPDPKPFGHFLGQTRSYLQRYPLALVGEVGLDKSFRIPEAWLPEHEVQRNDALTPGGREGRKLSPYRVHMDHQRKVFAAQLKLAGETHRAVSVHGVQAHGLVYETIASTWRGHERHPSSKKQRRRQGLAASAKGEADVAGRGKTLQQWKPYPPRICLHSFSGPAETVKQYTAPSVPCDVFFSFSVTINSWSETGDGKVEAAVKAVPDDCILIESDLHTAGTDMDSYLKAAVLKICDIKGWELQDGILRLGRNWKRFVFGR